MNSRILHRRRFQQIRFSSLRLVSVMFCSSLPLPSHLLLVFSVMFNHTCLFFVRSSFHLFLVFFLVPSFFLLVVVFRQHHLVRRCNGGHSFCADRHHVLHRNCPRQRRCSCAGPSLVWCVRTSDVSTAQPQQRPPVHSTVHFRQSVGERRKRLAQVQQRRQR